MRQVFEKTPVLWDQATQLFRIDRVFVQQRSPDPVHQPVAVESGGHGPLADRHRRHHAVHRALFGARNRLADRAGVDGAAAFLGSFKTLLANLQRVLRGVDSGSVSDRAEN